jgi:DHA1 family tetracycline resistance protein-like MFS transporter
LVLGYFVVPKTVTNNTRHPFDLKRTNPLRALTQIQKITDLSRFLLLFFLYQFAFYVYPAVWVYFAKAQFNWDSAMVSISLASFGISIAVVEGILIRHILPWLGERRTIELGPVFNIRIFIVLGLLTSGFWALLLAPISALGSLVIAAMRGIMANKAATKQQGEIQGIISSTQSLAVIFAPLVLTYVFYAGTPPNGPVFLPGAPFLLAAAIVALTLIIIVTRQKSSIGMAKSCRKVSQNLLHLSIHSVALL